MRFPLVPAVYVFIQMQGHRFHMSQHMLYLLIRQNKPDFIFDIWLSLRHLPRMPASALRFDYKTLTLGRRLTDQQLWVLGCDVRARPKTLSRLGWTYHSRPDKSKGCGRLTGMLPDGGHLSMWGFGFLARDLTHGALWLDRKGFRPRRRDDVDPTLPMFGTSDLPLFRAPENADQADAVLFLLGQMAERMADHEEDILALMGKDYRHACISQWKFRCSALDVEEVPSMWRHIANTLRDMRRTQNYAPGKKVAA